jgi:uncharacterized protein YjiS (DUF1127 family)
MDTISLGVRRQAHPVTRRGPVALLVLWLERARSRRQLRLLLANPHALADLGLTRDEADLETIKPFWR